MNGIVVVNKPVNYTSRDVVNKLNKIFNTKKIGHTGTLDPLATGVLVCLIGKYTKLVPIITAYDKEYIAEIKIGVKTDTGDITGKIIEENNYLPTRDEIAKLFSSFPKTYEQEVPIYSAVKVAGKKLYEYARSGEDIKLPKRMVTIYSLDLLEYNGNIIKFKARVSKGTYIRSLINDLCKYLNTVGTMASLVRTKQGDFSLEDSFSIEDLESGHYETKKIEEVLNIPVIKLDDSNIKIIVNGGKIDNIYDIKDKVLFKYDDNDIAIYEKNDTFLKPFIML